MYQQTVPCTVAYDNGLYVHLQGTKMGRPATDEFEKGRWVITAAIYSGLEDNAVLLNEDPLFLMEMPNHSYEETQYVIDKLFAEFIVNQPTTFWDVLDKKFYCFELEE